MTKNKEYRGNQKEEANEYHKAHRVLDKTKLQQSKKE